MLKWISNLAPPQKKEGELVNKCILSAEKIVVKPLLKQSTDLWTEMWSLHFTSTGMAKVTMHFIDENMTSFKFNLVWTLFIKIDTVRLPDFVTVSVNTCSSQSVCCTSPVLDDWRYWLVMGNYFHCLTVFSSLQTDLCSLIFDLIT